MSSQSSGSSPHARGLRHVHGCHDGGFRIIPARAGFTVSELGDGDGGQDHPRTRGVYLIISRAPLTTPGSSPHARGLLVGEGVALAAERIIPARAGFTPRQKGLAPQRWDHPRTRGVYTTHCAGTETTDGSSPHARGLLQIGGRRPGRSRIIPARAGFTLPVAAGGFFIWDHPRTRGVYAVY